jgi:hypothetical protein
MRRRVRLRVRVLACTAVLALTRALTPHYTHVFAGLATRMFFLRVLASSLLSSADSGREANASVQSAIAREFFFCLCARTYTRHD